MRHIAILSEELDFDHIKNILMNVGDEQCTLFTTKEQLSKHEDFLSVQIEFFPDYCDTSTKRHNFILKKFIGFHGMLHIVRDSVVLKDNASKFLVDLEVMMDALNLNSWFNSATDKMNYQYKKYLHRLNIALDVEQFKGFGLDHILFTSHANNNWTCYNMYETSEENISQFLLDERFSIPMFFIIEFLARRRKQYPDSLNLMNMYPTVPLEHEVLGFADAEEKQFPKEVLMHEDQLFKSMTVDFSPDNSIDMVLERTYNILKSRFVLYHNKKRIYNDYD